MKIALCIVATGERYRQYAKALIASVRRYFPCCIFLWTDKDDLGYGDGRADWTTLKSALGFPNETLYRYHTALSCEKELRHFDYVFQIDADFLVVDHVRAEDIISDGITATLHPGFLGTQGSPERDQRSFAYLSPDKQNQYYCGGFIGGKTSEFLKMAKWIKQGVDWDAQLNIKAIWNEESFVNKWLYYSPPKKILSPSFCYPQDYAQQYSFKHGEYKPILLALRK